MNKQEISYQLSIAKNQSEFSKESLDREIPIINDKNLHIVNSLYILRCIKNNQGISARGIYFWTGIDEEIIEFYCSVLVQLEILKESIDNNIKEYYYLG